MLNAKLHSNHPATVARQFFNRLKGQFNYPFISGFISDGVRNPKEPLFSLDDIDVEQVVVSRQGLLNALPHRGEMLLIDHIVWINGSASKAIAVKQLRHDEFWVAGHFPEQPVMPGVLMVEAGSQLALYLCKQHLPESKSGTLLKIESVRFRGGAVPGDRLLILCQLVERQRDLFSFEIQGLVGQRIAFEGKIVGWPRRANLG